MKRFLLVFTLFSSACSLSFEDMYQTVQAAPVDPRSVTRTLSCEERCEEQFLLCGSYASSRSRDGRWVAHCEDERFSCTSSCVAGFAQR